MHLDHIIQKGTEDLFILRLNEEQSKFVLVFIFHRGSIKILQIETIRVCIVKKLWVPDSDIIWEHTPHMAEFLKSDHR